jgi:hypothetical protein
VTNDVLTIDNVKIAIASALVLVAATVAYKALKVASVAYDNVDSVVDSVIDPLADSFFEWRLGDGVELPEFNVSRLYRDYFNDEWVMKSEPFELINKAYPNELRSILDEDNKLYVQYHNQVGGLI